MRKSTRRKQSNGDTLDRIARVLDAVRAIKIEHLEDLVRQAHECDINQINDPPEPFPITRQALRMFWHFRCNLGSVEQIASHG
ncbi:MAG TPA: hypothetical protein PKN33_06105 [Phycisphaerae bacterium]|nr:hypothetical protein [Phycisphaerae bacterium]